MKMLLSGNTLRNEKIIDSRFFLEETFADDASYTNGIYRWEHGLKSYSDRTPIKIRFYKRSFSNANGWTLKFQTLFDEPVIIGDMFYDLGADEYYICTESFNIDDIHWQGEFTLCNWILKWQDKNTGEILEYPCYDLNSTQYNSGETANRQFVIGTSQHQLTLTCDENTVSIKTPQRFYLDKDPVNPRTFKVTQNDTTSWAYGKKGLVKITVSQYEGDTERDRPDLGICDYIEPSEFEQDTSKNQYIEEAVISYDSLVIRSGGDAQTFYGKFYDNNGEEIADAQFNWDIICNFENILEISKSDNWIRISVDNDEIVDEDFRLILSDDSGDYTASIIVRIESLL